jgi:hypothetical protein
MLRLAGITRPLLGNFGDYQAGMAMIARHFAEGHFTTILYPQTYDLVNGQPSLVLLFYPLSSLLAAALHVLSGLSLDFLGRLQSVVFFAGAALLLYRLVARISGRPVALAALIAFSLSPLTIVYGQSFLNDMGAVFFILLFFYASLRFLAGINPLDFLAASAALSCVLLMRPNAVYLVLPSFWLGRKHLIKMAAVWAAGCVLPALWYVHVWRVSAEAPNIYMTLAPQLASRASFLSPIVFSPAYYRDLWDILAGMAFTPLGITLFLVGCFQAGRVPGAPFYLLWGASFLASSLAIPRKLVEHDFYLLQLMMPSAPIVGAGFLAVAENWQGSRQALSRSVAFFVVIACLVSFRYALYPAFRTPERERGTLKLAGALRQVTEKGRDRAVVQGTRTILYYADRYGWHAFPLRPGKEGLFYHQMANWQNLPPDQWQKYAESLTDPIKHLEYLREYEGATHFVVSDPEAVARVPNFAEYLAKNYSAIFREEGVGTIFLLSARKEALSSKS